MYRLITLLLTGIFSFSLSAALVPRIKDVVLAQDGKNRAIINYTLDEAPGIVTFEILTNGVSIGGAVLTNATGDVNKLLPVGKHTIKWEPWVTWPDHKFTNACVCARVKAWPTNSPPDWLAIDLTQSKDNAPVTYYADQDFLPWGKIWLSTGANVKYKGDVILMRRIPATHVLSLMGSPETETGHVAGRETRRFCTLTNDFYIAIYPTTYRQVGLLNDGPETKAQGLYPFISYAYNQLRYHTGNMNNTALPVNFPTTSRTFVGGTSFLKNWRNKTGLTLDIPTAAQWEYACRCDSDGPYHYWHNQEMPLSMFANIYTYGTYEVGKFAGSDWYLFDLYGNCYEWCLDYFEENITADAVTDPLGPTSDPDANGKNQIRRKMKGYNADTKHWRSAFFTGQVYNNAGCGFRLCITLP